MFFRSSRIRTLVAMVTNSSYRLIMGKEEIVFFSVSFGIIFGISSYRNVNRVVFYVSYNFFFKSVNLIGCRCCKKGQFS